jgi:ATP-dependent DNA ligase
MGASLRQNSCAALEGRSQFNPLLRGRGQASLYAFDLVWLNGEDLRLLPLLHRKDRLQKRIFRSQLPGVISASYIEDHGKARFEEVCERDLEGIVAKRKRTRLTVAR